MRLGVLGMKVYKLFYTVKEAAAEFTRRLGRLINAQRVYYLIRQGRLAAIRTIRGIRIGIPSTWTFGNSTPS